MLGTHFFWERCEAIGKGLGDVEKLSVRKEGNASKGLGGKELSNTEIAFGEGEIWVRMGQEKMGLNWGEKGRENN